MNKQAPITYKWVYPAQSPNKWLGAFTVRGHYYHCGRHNSAREAFEAVLAKRRTLALTFDCHINPETGKELPRFVFYNGEAPRPWLVKFTEQKVEGTFATFEEAYAAAKSPSATKVRHNIRVDLPHRAWLKFAEAAESRNISVAVLIQRVMKATAAGDLIEAVLDDKET